MADPTTDSATATLWGTSKPPSSKLSEASLKKARKRKVYVRADGEWVVFGLVKKDSHPTYLVTEGDGPNTSLHCSCYDEQYGETRKRKGCSHVASVEFFERGELVWQVDGVRCDRDGKLVVDGLSDGRGDSGVDSGDGIEDQEDESQEEVVSPLQPAIDLLQSELHEALDSTSEISSSRPVAGRPPESAAVASAGGREPHHLAPTGTPFDDWARFEGLAPTDPAFGLPPIPEKFSEFRPGQWTAIREAVDHFENGVKVVFLSAPTGSGKTLISDMTARLALMGHDDSRRIFACTTKTLQDQVDEDFLYAKVLKGRANYPTLNGDGITADDCTKARKSLPACSGCPSMDKLSAMDLTIDPDHPDGDPFNGMHCNWCHPTSQCPYQVAKLEAMTAPLAILNTAYFLAETSIPTSAFRGAMFVTIDEADALERSLQSHIEVSISPSVRADCGVKTIPKVTVESDWGRWLKVEMIPALDRKLKTMTGQGQFGFGRDPDLKHQRKEKSYRRLLGRLQEMVEEIGDGWVLTDYKRAENPNQKRLTFKPVRIDRYAHEYLWDRAEKFLLMSASFISPAHEAQSLGLKDGEWAEVIVDSTFPVENRPIFYEPTASVTYKTKDKAYPVIAEKIDEIIADNQGARVLVHTVSYDLGETIYGMSQHRDRILTYRNSHERERVLAQFVETPDAVLFAPSFERGVDLPGELCSVIIVPKVPWPSLGDEQIKARMYSRGGDAWYTIQTIRSMVQMTGRGMRSPTDTCDTYVLDRNFGRILSKNKRMLPKWWSEAVVSRQGHPETRKMYKLRDERRDARNLAWQTRQENKEVVVLPDPF